MGRELKRVALDFSWPIETVWKGFLNPHYTATDCGFCGGTGSSPTARLLQDKWYGNAPFKPENRGSVPFQPSHPAIQKRAEHAGEASRHRLCRLFNSRWMHHLDERDVAALLAADRLYDFTHQWDKDAGWTPKLGAPVPTPAQVNEWSLFGMGHDSLNCWIVVKAECARLNVNYHCEHCDGQGHIWPSKEDKEKHDLWKSEQPPAGEGYQMWETVSEGSPISPVFTTADELAEWLANNNRGVDVGTSKAQWLKFINGPGWAPSLVADNRGVLTGVQSL